ncbi:MAG: xanthine dehydrogenase family protein molybdopterin-binding subunit [Paracoccus sp. (in: a-proteobacteria)]
MSITRAASGPGVSTTVSLNRRQFIASASGTIAVSVLGLPATSAAQAPAQIRFPPGSPILPGIATQRIDGHAKVTGAKVFARDFMARDMPGWPATQWHAVYLYALTTDHAFLGLDLSGLSEAAQPRRVVYGDNLSEALRAPKLTARRDLALDQALRKARQTDAPKGFDRPAGLEFDLIVPRKATPDFLGQAVALLLFDSAAGWRQAQREMRFRDETWQVYATDVSHSAGMGTAFQPQTTYVKFDQDGDSFSYATADPATYSQQVPEYRARIAATLAANPDYLTQPLACDMQATDPMFMEPEAGLVWYDRANAALNIVLGTQSPDGDVRDLGEMFGSADSPVRVAEINLTSCYPGGGFGGRDSSPFTLLLALAAPFADGHPVRLALDRFEQFRTGLKRHGASLAGALTAGPDMKLKLVEMRIAFDGGGRKNLSPYAASLSALCAGGAYQIPMADIFAEARHSQNISGGSQRGFGGPQAYFAVETALDDLAAAQGWDPVALRRANLVADDGTTVAGGPIAQELRLPEILDRAEAHPLWRDRAAIKADFAGRGLSYGTGLALSLQAYGTSGDGMVAAVRMTADGSFAVQSDAVDMGNGSATTLAVAIGEYLGANADSIDMADYNLFGQTGLTTDDPQGQRWNNPQWTPKGTGSSSACLTGLHQVHTVKETARALFEASLLPAARLLWNRPDIAAEQVQWLDGQLQLRDGTAPGLSHAELARAVHAVGLPTGALGHGYFQSGWAEADFDTRGGPLHLRLDGLSLYAPGASAPIHIPRANTTGPDSLTTRYSRYVWAPCLNVVGLTVDRTNGRVEVQNVLTILNAGRIHVPELVSGQSQGGVAMAIGYALMEDMPPGMAGPANGLWNLNRYHLPRMADVPLADRYAPGTRAQELVILDETPGDGRAGRGIAEAVMCSIAPAISNALRDATGRRHASLPITPQKILEGLSP